MRWLLKVSLLFVTVTTIESVTLSAHFLLHKNKRLTTTAVTKTFTIYSPRLCVNYCLATDGCLAANFHRRFKPSCKLTSDHVTMNNLADHNNSDVYVVDKCVEEPRFCLNGAICEPTWRSARCHCGDRYQGDRCDTCAAGYYGESCDYVFVERLGHNCLPGNDLQITPGNNAEEIEACKEVCARNQLYGGFVVYNRKCLFKPPRCKNDVYPDGVDLYVKETVEG